MGVVKSGIMNLLFLSLVTTLVAHTWSLRLPLNSAIPKTSNSSRKYSLKRRHFPPDFKFGASISSYQHEGATWVDGRRPSIWDAFAHAHPEKIRGRANGDVSSDSYHLYKDDIALAKQLGLDTFRFSLSWSRILPRGKLSGGINQKGIDHYNNVINEILAQGLTPFLSLLHLDYPQILEDEYSGFLSTHIVEDFRDYADVCFKAFGDRIKHWVTINEPRTLILGGYDVGDMAPGHCTSVFNWTCDAGNSSTEPYIVGHNQLLAHAAAVHLYRQKYQATQKGMIGISMNADWIIPYSSSKGDIQAAKRALDFTFGWFMDPIYKGDYPENMKRYLGDRLPRFSKQESALLKRSYDYLGINYYTTQYALDRVDYTNPHHPNGYDDHVQLSFVRNGQIIGPQTVALWMTIYPRGLYCLLLYIKNTYQNPLIYITENGFPDSGNYAHSPLEAPPDDDLRVSYLRDHLSSLRRAMRKGANVKGYMVWSLIDGFEWVGGYNWKFGLYYVDIKAPWIRIPKLSAIWFRNFLKGSN